MALFDFSGLAGLLGGNSPYAFPLPPQQQQQPIYIPGMEGSGIPSPSSAPQNPWANAPGTFPAMPAGQPLPFAGMTNPATGLANVPVRAPTLPPINIPPTASPSPQAAAIPPSAQPTGPATPQTAQPPSQPSSMNPLSAIFGSGGAGLLNGGGLPGAFQSLFQAVMPQQANLQFQHQMMMLKVQSTAQALMQRNPNITPQQALAMALDPAMLEASIKPQVVQPGGQLVTPLDLNGKGQPQAGAQNGVYQNSSGLLSGQTLRTMADQYIAGDTSVLQNLGRTAAGAINVQKLRDTIAQRMNEQGISPQDQAVKMAAYKGLTTAQQALGTRQATIGMAGSEVEQMAPLVIQASAAVNRTNFPALNSVLLAGAKGIGDPNVVRLGQSVNSLINAYARAINPNGQSTVSDKDHARELLSASWTQGQLSAGVDQLLREIAAAKRAPGVTQKEISDLYAGKGSPVTSGVTQSGLTWSVK